MQEDREGSPTEVQIMVITTAYEQGVGKGEQYAKNGTISENPYSSDWNLDYAWELGYKEGWKMYTLKQED